MEWAALIISAVPLSSPLSSRDKPLFPEPAQILRIWPVVGDSAFDSCLKLLPEAQEVSDDSDKTDESHQRK